VVGVRFSFRVEFGTDRNDVLVTSKFPEVKSLTGVGCRLGRDEIIGHGFGDCAVISRET